MGIRKKILNFANPILKPLAHWYLSKPRTYTFKKIKIVVYPGVFHPGLFFSTKILIRHASQQKLDKLRILELGAGSGLLSIYCAKQGATVTASDINPLCISNIQYNAKANNQEINIIESNLFELVSPDDFDIIYINPPYYPRKPKTLNEQAWFCGENYEYFNRLFFQLKEKKSTITKVIMILSEDCELDNIMARAKIYNLKFDMIRSESAWGEKNHLYSITNE
jgi:release factor glutamine methyltransferase